MLFIVQIYYRCGYCLIFCRLRLINHLFIRKFETHIFLFLSQHTNRHLPKADIKPTIKQLYASILIMRLCLYYFHYCRHYKFHKSRAVAMSKVATGADKYIA